MKRKSVISVLFLFLLTGLVTHFGTSPGKSITNQRKWWDEKLGDAWNIWLDECENEAEKEMVLAAFAKLEESMIDGSYFDISSFLNGDAELAITPLIDHTETEHIRIEGDIEN